MKDNSMITYRMFVQGTVTRSIIVENTVTRPIIVEDAKDLEEAKRKAINEWSNLTGGSLDTGEVIQSTTWIVDESQKRKEDNKMGIFQVLLAALILSGALSTAPPEPEPTSTDEAVTTTTDEQHQSYKQRGIPMRGVSYKLNTKVKVRNLIN